MRETEWKIWTPADAANAMTKCSGQRNLNNNRVRLYAREMAAGRWTTGVDPIVFDEDDNLINGQHRLAAVILAKIPVTVLTVRGMPRAAIRSIDMGAPRRTADLVKIYDGMVWSTNYCAIANRMMHGIGHHGYTISPGEIREFGLRHRENITIALEATNKMPPGVRVAAVGAVIARALYTIQPSKLLEAADVLVTSIASKPGHRSLVVLRDWLLRRTVAGSGCGNSGWVAGGIAYRKTERAFVAYLNGQYITVLRELPCEAFPLPESP